MHHTNMHMVGGRGAYDDDDDDDDVLPSSACQQHDNGTHKSVSRESPLVM